MVKDIVVNNTLMEQIQLSLQYYVDNIVVRFDNCGGDR